MEQIRKISISDIPGVRIGHAQDTAAGTGCTVCLFGKDGAPAGLDIAGGGPASRESGLLHPLAAADRLHAILLSGGSAFGLNAAGGVMRYLRECGIGVDTGVMRVPLVAQSCLFDLAVGDAGRFPDEDMAYAACRAADGAEASCFQNGNVGAGAGATVGKLLGMEHCMKSGIGTSAVQLGEVRVGAVAAVNAFGDIRDPRDGQKIAGTRSADGRVLPATDELLAAGMQTADAFGKNTTLGVIFTNTAFDKTALCRIASMAQDGLARTIYPVHTSVDGDSVYAVSLGDAAASPDLVGTLASRVMAEAILDAVRSAQSAYGFPGLAG